LVDFHISRINYQNIGFCFESKSPVLSTVDYKFSALFRDINPAINYVISAAAKRRAGIQKKPRYYWIPAFAGMTGWCLKVALFNCQINIPIHVNIVKETDQGLASAFSRNSSLLPSDHLTKYEPGFRLSLR